MEHSTMARFTMSGASLAKAGLGAAIVAGWAFFASNAALAQSSCNDDMKRLTEAREAQLAQINALAAASKGKPMDAAVACGKARGLNVAESALVSYMDKNKDWCGIPDEVVNGLKAAHAKSVAFGTKACTVAAQMKKQREAGAQADAPHAAPLPAGPL
jgi:hypothetical protein